MQELLKTNQTKLLGVREKLTDLHKHYKELETQQNRDTTQVEIIEKKVCSTFLEREKPIFLDLLLKFLFNSGVCLSHQGPRPPERHPGVRQADGRGEGARGKARSSRR